MSGEAAAAGDVGAAALRRRFVALLDQPGPVVVPGAHDALSARLVEQAGYPAVYVGSYGTSAAAFGLPDVGSLTLGELADHAGRVARAVAVPVLADAEAGFFEPAGMWRTVDAFERAGVCGIHVEDHAGGKHTLEGRAVQPLELVVQRIRAAVEARTDPNFLVIARTDAIWATGNLDEALRRMAAFADAGADLVFPTGIDPATLARVRDQIPARVLVLGDLPPSSMAQLRDAGADVIVYYSFTVTAATRAISQALAGLRSTEDVRQLGDLLEDTDTFERRLPYDAYLARAQRYRVHH
ncbi:isocitrate lyase/PEP mutase family protein [Blastococcus atacamensis]|uniref:isocitrate lyase/PEP mutase family protein n=1 Tax=Blastococcus atacamensis TaxID=2070508 RepID=UPI000CEC5C6C|nr:isocitrate lyase/PEP mutase family protein [Blastococcus atacamensis]